MPVKSVLAFDIGIRNLGWCILKSNTDLSGSIEVLGWDNYNLLDGQSANTIVKQTCGHCSAKATYESMSTLYCVRHCIKPALRDLSGNQLKKLPNATGMKQMVTAKGMKAGKTKIDLVNQLQTIYSLPIVKAKVKKAIDTELAIIHDGIRRLVTERNDVFSTVNEILLENQPVLKNPTMKSVQILLFATLRDLIQDAPPLRLVHAKNKVKEGKKGDAGYKDRKDGSEIRVEKILNGSRVDPKWKAHLGSYAKKNDLTDAFCMCLDSLGIQ